MKQKQPTSHWQHILIAIISVIAVLGTGTITFYQAYQNPQDMASMGTPIPGHNVFLICAIMAFIVLFSYFYFTPSGRTKMEEDQEPPEPIDHQGRRY